MKIVHFYKKHFDKGDGITNVVVNLSSNQNSIDNVSSIDIPVLSDNSAKLNKEFNISSIFDAIKKGLYYKPDVVVIHGVFYPIFFVLLFVFKVLDKKVIIVPHCSLLKTSMDRKNFKKRLYMFFFKRFVLDRCDAVHLLNEFENETSLYIDESIKRLVIPNGVNLTVNNEKRFDKFNCFYLGRCDIHHKGIDILLENLKQSKEYIPKFSIYGASQLEMGSIKSLSEKLHISSYLEIFPAVFGEKKKEVFENNNIFVMTSRYEGMPISILEALSYGCICLVSSGTNMADVITEHQCGLEISENFTLADAMKVLTTLSEEELSIMSDNARLLAKSKYNWSKIASNSIDLYRHL